MPRPRSGERAEEENAEEGERSGSRGAHEPLSVNSPPHPAPGYPALSSLGPARRPSPLIHTPSAPARPARRFSLLRPSPTFPTLPHFPGPGAFTSLPPSLFSSLFLWARVRVCGPQISPSQTLNLPLPALKAHVNSWVVLGVQVCLRVPNTFVPWGTRTPLHPASLQVPPPGQVALAPRGLPKALEGLVVGAGKGRKDREPRDLATCSSAFSWLRHGCAASGNENDCGCPPTRPPPQDCSASSALPPNPAGAGGPTGVGQPRGPPAPRRSAETRRGSGPQSPVGESSGRSARSELGEGSPGRASPPPRFSTPPPPRGSCCVIFEIPN